MPLEEFILNFPEDLAPLRTLAERLYASDTQTTDDAICLSHRPRIAPQAFALRLYRPLPESLVARYEAKHNFSISPHYARLLPRLNGAFAFKMSLFGLPASMLEGLLDRSTLQPLDLATANKHWKTEYSVADDWFHFGGGQYSHDENIGYFVDGQGIVHSARKGGTVLASWQSFKDFLSDELSRAEAAFPVHEEFMASLQRRAESERQGWLARLFRRPLS